MSDVYIVPTGSANMASVMAAIRRCGANVLCTSSSVDVERATRLVLPGVGSFGAVMQTLRRCRLIEPLQQRFRNGLPTLGICLGLQVLAESSEESPGVSGLGILQERVRRFPCSLRTPHMGWNEVLPESSTSLINPGYAYFANSYRIERSPPGWNATYAAHGGQFIAALQKGSILACQFHPELSGVWGQRLLHRWLVRSEQEAALC